MRTLKFYAANAFATALALPMVLSCAKEPVENLIPAHPSIETVTLHLSAQATKTSLQDDKTVLWSEGDKVVINHTLYAVTVDPENPAFAIVDGVEKANEYYAVYVKGSESGTEENFGPQYDFYADSGVNWYSVYLYPYQHYFTDTFAPFTNPMVGYSTDTDIKFYNLGSVVKVGLTGNGEAISRVILKANGGRTISGLLKLSEEQIRAKNYSEAVFDAKYNNLMRSFVWLTCDAQQTVVLSSTPIWFYFVTVPFTDEAGISIVVEDTEGNVFTRTKTDAFSIGRSEIKEMDPLEYKASKKIDLTPGEPSPVSISVNASTGEELSVRYVAVFSSVWENLRNSGWEEQKLASAFLSETVSQTHDGGDFVMNFETARNTTGNMVAIAAETSYKVIAQYCSDGMGVGTCAILDVTTSAAIGSAPALDVAIESFTYNEIHARITSDAPNVSVWLFAKEMYNSMGKSDSEIMKEYGKPLDTEQIAQANAGGCEWNWWNLSPLTDYVILVIATSSTGMETIVKKEIATEWYLFNPNTTVLETVSTEATFSTNMFGNPLTITPIVLKKVPGMDVFVIENLFKGNTALAELGFIEEEGTYLTIIDARDKNAVDISFDMNKLGIYNSTYLGFNYDLSFGCYATYNTNVSQEDYPLGTYDSENNAISIVSLILGNPDRIYGMSSCTLTWPLPTKSMTVENFSKTQAGW